MDEAKKPMTRREALKRIALKGVAVASLAAGIGESRAEGTIQRYPSLASGGETAAAAYPDYSSYSSQAYSRNYSSAGGGVYSSSVTYYSSLGYSSMSYTSIYSPKYNSIQQMYYSMSRDMQRTWDKLTTPYMEYRSFSYRR